MKRLRVWIALGLVLLPLAARSLWFYRGVYRRQLPVPTPDYSSLTMPVPPVSPAQVAWPSSAPGEKVVLFDLAHGNLVGLTELEALTRALTGMGARLETTLRESPSLTDTLKYASAYVVLAPSLSFTPGEVQQVRRFVEQGGRVLVIADPTRVLLGENVSVANDLLTLFDLSLSEDYVYNLIENEGNYRNVLFHQFAYGSLTGGLETVAFYGACSVGTTTGTALIQGDEHTLSSRTDTGGNLAVAALSANGQVLAMGDLTFLTPPYYQVADNTRLIGHIAEFLVGGERARDLADAPFLFSRPVAVVPTKSVTLTADIAEPLGKWQAALRPLGITFGVTAVPTLDSDWVVLGSYAPGDDLLPYLAPLIGTSMTETTFITGVKGPGGPVVPIPGLGKISRFGTGLAAFSHDDKHTMLVLLADTPEGLGRLVEILASGDLTPCAVQERAALCNIARSRSASAP